MGWRANVKSEDLFLPIVSLQAFAVAAGAVGCSDSLFCNCIAADFQARGPYVIGFNFLSVLLEWVFAENALSWLSFPFSTATFATANKDLPDWAWGHAWSLHVWMVVVTATTDGAVAVYRSLQNGNRASAVVVGAGLVSYGALETLRRSVDDPSWPEHLQGIVSVVALFAARVVAAATIHARRRGARAVLPPRVQTWTPLPV
jgi:hypothetical protein